MKQLLREIISSLSKSEKRQLYRMLKDSLLKEVNSRPMPKEMKIIEVWQVYIPANIYNGKYYDYQTVPFYVIANSEEEAIDLVNKNKDKVLEKISKKRTQSGRRYVHKDVARNVFFKDIYSVKKIEIATAKPENILGYNEELHGDFDYLNDMDSIASDDPNAPYDPDDYLPPQYRDIKCPQCGELTPEDDLVCIHCDYDRSYDSKVRR